MSELELSVKDVIKEPGDFIENLIKDGNLGNENEPRTSNSNIGTQADANEIANENLLTSSKKRMRKRPTHVPMAVPDNPSANQSGVLISDQTQGLADDKQQIDNNDYDDKEQKKKNPFAHLGLFPSSFDQNVLSIHLHQTYPLPLDKHLLHPMIRIHILDTHTGEYIKKTSPERSVSQVGEPKDLDFVLPVMSKVCVNVLHQRFRFVSHCDFTPHPLQPLVISADNGLRADWNEEIVLNDEYLNFVREGVVIIFEMVGLAKMTKIMKNTVRYTLYRNT